jgi:hypothetical protein
MLAFLARGLQWKQGAFLGGCISGQWMENHTFSFLLIFCSCNTDCNRLRVERLWPLVCDQRESAYFISSESNVLHYGSSPRQWRNDILGSIEQFLEELIMSVKGGKSHYEQWAFCSS